MQARKRIALVAHDRKKPDLIHWVRANEAVLAGHDLWATGTTGALVLTQCPRLELVRVKSGPLGGDQQIGALIAEGAIDVLIFFTDPLSPHPHEADVQALTRLSALYNVALALNRSTADFLIASPWFGAAYAAPTGGGDGQPGGVSESGTGPL